MGVKTFIQYPDSTVNELVGCEGCELWTRTRKVCYAGKMIRRLGSRGGVWPEEFTKPIMVLGRIQKALNWSDLTGTDRESKPWLNGYPRIIFINDMSDSFMNHIWIDGVKTPLPVDWLAPLLPAMMDKPHIYLLLTKRANRAVEFFSGLGGVPENFWVGVSVTEPYTSTRARKLLELRDKCEGKLWASLEPLYPGTMNNPFSKMPDYVSHLDWVVVGGESGPGAIETRLPDIASTIEVCHKGNTKVFVKQFGSAHGEGKGGDWDEWPEDLRKREMPSTTTTGGL